MPFSRLNIINASETTIICYKVNACDEMTIYSNTNNVTFYFYNYNENINIHLPDELNLDNLHCIDDAYFSFDGNTAYDQSILAHTIQLFQSKPPCQDISFEFTNTGHASSH